MFTLIRKLLGTCLIALCLACQINAIQTTAKDTPMYQLDTSAFGAFQLYKIQHSVHPHSISFVPERGGCLLSIILDGAEVLDGCKTPEEVDFNRWGKSGMLYPFPNRLKDGRYTWQGQTYQFPLNDAPFNNALHGFGMNRPLVVKAIELDSTHAKVNLEGSYDGSLPYYPWAFTFGVVYTLYAPEQLWVELYLRNDAADTIPVGLGWHPYFQLGDHARDLDLQLPGLDLVGIDKGMIPTGKRYAHTAFSKRRNIGATILDNCFAVTSDSVEVSAHLYGERGHMRYWQETGPGKFAYMQIFMPPTGTSIALEPMTCNVDAFNNGDGLRALAPGDTLRAKAGVTLER